MEPLVRDAEGNWTYNDLGSKVGSKVNGVEVTGIPHL